jgi:hypothetical protein
MAAREVHPGAERDHGELRTLVREREEAVRDLVQGPVAADRYDLLRTVGGGPRDQLGEVPRAFREERDALQAELRRAVSQLRPAPPGRPVVRGGVDEECSVSAQR